MRHPKVIAWERKLKSVFDEIDAQLEEQYGGRYVLHPARPRRGATSNPESDGLFNIGAAFSAGFGSRYGRGYVVRVHMATLSRVPPEVREAIEEQAAEMLREKLSRTFPGQELRVERDGRIYKIIGDLGLGVVR